MAVYHGRLWRGQQHEAVADFEGPADTLPATEVGGERRTLQFRRTVVNDDPRWNPMAIEQPVDRVRCIGRSREVHLRRSPGPVRLRSDSPEARRFT